MAEAIINFIKDFQVILVPLGAMSIAQLIKIVIEWIKYKKLVLSHPYRYGGMPSSHSAAVAAATIYIGLIEGVRSTFFALTLLLAVLVIRDAVGLRMELTKHGIAINKLVSRLPNGEKGDFALQSERVGHTFWQVVAGSILGAGLGILFWWIIQML